IEKDESPSLFGMGTTVSLSVSDEPRALVEALNDMAERMRRQRSETIVAPIIYRENSIGKMSTN
ncbi:hypothetical protein KDH83_32160, partial [Achromobacter sp. Marseille-Q0513]|uniref:hypothetical protein n=1 Tax=Achromobacter sp. Marseille-Q0513 TaxID=2829161 RepID=UPI001B90F5A9